ncbi:hypothetical protein C483_15397 [Natrialba hulunbeirensis JCM 10989]|uniref:Uncharacterized protein n=1 Tax=Natrialba hulunbeirensis JCM 10989 TaxID=1227493 RepID=L9ZU70_9EURY|nr:hypothetical protein [Natrialba hulunbeirensis]ELY88733.1 hypothetical protein C483_15397 [Natrialba hulunbeirensis JCM 10989]
MDESIGQRGAIAFLIERVAIPLLIVFGAFLLGARTTDVLFESAEMMGEFLLVLLFGAVYYVLALPLYWAVFLRE